jgi:DNA polymerase
VTTNHLSRHIELERLCGADFLPRRHREKRASGKTDTEFLDLRVQALGCMKCGLCKTRTQVVFGTGPLTAPLMFVGEAPGKDEDLQGEPFVGQAGQLLTSTLEKIGVKRDRVYIANILKCRPPGNRTPQPDEMAACMDWLLGQIRMIKPKLLCAMGNIAAQTLLDTKTGITKLRGKTLESRVGPLFPTFHPAYILRNRSDLPLFESDLREACRLAGLLFLAPLPKNQ